MGLFGKERRERRKIKKQVDKLMKQYQKEKIDGETYFNKMMDLASSRRNKNK